MAGGYNGSEPSAADYKTGTLWEGRYEASLVERKGYLLTCHRCIELNPVRAGMTRHPGDYHWSSYRAHAQGESEPFLRDHEVYLELGAAPAARQRRYRELFRDALADSLLQEVRAAVNHCHVLGNQRFKAQVEAMLGRKLGTGRPGRPRREQDSTDAVDGQLKRYTK